MEYIILLSSGIVLFAIVAYLIGRKYKSSNNKPKSVSNSPNPLSSSEKKRKVMKTNNDLSGQRIESNTSNLLIEKLLFPNIKGLNYNEIITDFEDAEISLQKNIDNNWHYSQYPLLCLMKSFSKKTFEDELKKLLSANNLKYSNLKLNGGVKSWDFKVKSNIPESANFALTERLIERGVTDLKSKSVQYTIEMHESSDYNLIFIINTSGVDKKSIELLETDLTSKKHKIDWVNGLTIFDGQEVIKKDNSLFKAKNVPLLFHDDESELEYILIPHISHISHSKPIIESIIKNNGGPKKFKPKEIEGWSNLYDGENFTIGYVDRYKVVRLNKHRIIDSYEKLEAELSQLNEAWNNIFNSRASFRTISVENLKMSVLDMSRSHTNEYIERYENGDNYNGMEDTLYRIDIINKFIEKFEKYFEYCVSSGTRASKECLNKFFTIVESLIGTEMMVIYLMDGDTLVEKLKGNDIFKRKSRVNSKKVKNINDTNKKLVDIFEYTFYNDMIFNGVISYFDKQKILEEEIPFRFGLKHGIRKTFHKNGKLKSESLLFNDTYLGDIAKYDEDGNSI